MSITDRLKGCIEWCKANGSHIDDRIEFRHTQSTGITAIASAAITTKKSLISIPKGLLITNEIAQKEFGLEENIYTSKSNPNAITQLCVAKWKFSSNESCFYWPYISILPLELNQPYFWPVELLNTIRGTDLHMMLKQNLTKMANEWIDLLDSLKLETDDGNLYKQWKSSQEIDILSLFSQNNTINADISWTSFPAYVWATCIFNSRAFPEIILNAKVSNINQAFLYPIVDLLNHKNDTKVRWLFQNNDVEFITHESLKPGDEVFNSYGDKSNEELILNYGFVQENNAYDFTRLSLRLDKEILENACNFGVISQNRIVGDNCVQFQLSIREPLPEDLIKFFGFLCKLKSESQLTLRCILEGQDKLNAIITQKIDFFKKNSKLTLHNSANSDIVQTIKQYFHSERRIYHSSLEEVQKHQRKLMKGNAVFMTSFKTIFKSDKEFANSILIAFGILKFEDLVTQDRMREALLLWIVRVSNKDSYPKKPSYSTPPFIHECFQDVSKSIVIEKEDVMEFMTFYKNLFPNLGKKIPETFDVGNWGIRQFIVADTVMDRLVWTRKQTQEPYFIKQEPF